MALGFDAFCRDLETHGAGDIHDGADDAAHVGLLIGGTDERAVDFQFCERKLPQVVQAGITGAEVVERDAAAEFTQGGELLQHHFRIADHGAFSDFDFETIGRQA